MNRLPPHNLDAEAAVLSAMLMYREAIDAAAPIVEPGMFYSPAHAHVCEAITKLYRSGDPVNTVTVIEELDRAGLRDEAGPKVTELAGILSGWSTAEHHARTVAAKAKLRRLAAAASEITELAFSNPSDAQQAVQQSEALLFELNDHSGEARGQGRWLADLLGQNLDDLETLVEQGGATAGIPTGFRDLDDKLNGLQPGRLYVVAARPSMGKVRPGRPDRSQRSRGERATVAVFLVGNGRRRAVAADAERRGPGRWQQGPPR